jgi:hypothetical protein
MIETLRDGPPYPMYLARSTDDFLPPEWLLDWYRSKTIEWFKTTGVSVVSRGVKLSRLEFVLQNGIDVEPGRPLWVAIGLEKAWEYGGLPKLLLVLDQDRLQPPNLDFSLDTAGEKRGSYKRQNEQEYCRLPAGDPCSLLVALIIVLTPDAPSDWIKCLVDPL